MKWAGCNSSSPFCCISSQKDERLKPRYHERCPLSSTQQFIDGHRKTERLADSRLAVHIGYLWRQRCAVQSLMEILPSHYNLLSHLTVIRQHQKQVKSRFEICIAQNWQEPLISMLLSYAPRYHMMSDDRHRMQCENVVEKQPSSLVKRAGVDNVTLSGCCRSHTFHCLLDPHFFWHTPKWPCPLLEPDILNI